MTYIKIYYDIYMIYILYGYIYIYISQKTFYITDCKCL